jgi:hypothetical protein
MVLECKIKTNMDFDLPIDKLSKLRGFYKMPRDLILKLFSRDLTFNQFGLLVIYLGFADWDSTHRKFGTTNISNNELRKCIIGLDKNKIAVEKWILAGKNFIEIERLKSNAEIITIKNPKLYFPEKVSHRKDRLSSNKESNKK